MKLLVISKMYLVFFGYQKSLGSGDRDILLSKLYHCGIRGTAHKLFNLYLKGQRVKIDCLFCDTKRWY